ncbi:MAG: hypothetical protein ACREPG_10600 [Candidatus Binatia bacterium]
MSNKEIAEVDVGTSERAMRVLSFSEPETPYQAKYSMPYCIAAALVDGHVTLDTFTPRKFEDHNIVEARKYLARKDAKVMGLIGSGEQAKTQVTAHACVRQLTKIKVYSPTKANREKFAREMSQQNGIEIVPVSSAQEAVRGSDIVSAATNTVDPVVEGRWLEAGMHVTSLVGGDGFLPRKELDDEAIQRANLIVVGYKAQIFLDKQAEFYDRIERGIIKAEDLHELGELLNGNCRGRQDEKEITLFKNNTGMGIQFAATARKMYEKAREKGIGAELPLELFMTKRGDKLFSP